ncbi:helix-turn-helix domain-containing protein [Paenibacillus filicis]|uniref:Helix-turn-helix domain-containing protein n=1 Tax=Paenibacillus filicis TaxID=669464 RepID=A0ABU9DRR2_9BACL
MLTFRDTEYSCTSEVTLSLISGKWKILILSFLAKGTLRFNELQKLVPDATQRMLTLQLRTLEKDGLIARTVYAVSPPKVEYTLTEFGQRLVPMLSMLCRFGADYVEAHGSTAPEPQA